jgi:DUF1680 family protein
VLASAHPSFPFPSPKSYSELDGFWGSGQKLLDGVMVLEHQGSHEDAPPSTALYYAADAQEPEASTATLKLIPYYAWANREPSEMQVWIPYIRT